MRECSLSRVVISRCEVFEEPSWNSNFPTVFQQKDESLGRRVVPFTYPLETVISFPFMVMKTDVIAGYGQEHSGIQAAITVFSTDTAAVI